MTGRDIEIGCRCGAVRGIVKNVSPETVMRAVCYCDDCQAFAHHLGRADLLDEHGGSDVVQVAPAALVFDHGGEHVVGLRLSPKGLYRWYATCCKTPLGNTLSPGIPFVGIAVQAFAGSPEEHDVLFGKSRGSVRGEYAIGTPPPGSTKANLRLIFGALRKVLGWRLRRKTWPHPYFDHATHLPLRPVTILSPAERDALRPFCGPQPTKTAHATADALKTA